MVVVGAPSVLAVPVSLHAQRRQTARLGILHASPRDRVFDSMIQRLGEFGWVEGRNLSIEFHVLSTEPQWAAAAVEELLRLKCDVILANGTPAALVTKAHAPTTPIVFIVGGDPVGLGLVVPLPRPGGNATGYMQRSHEIITKQLSLLRELVPAARRIAIMFEAGNPSMLQGVQALQAAAAGPGIVVRPVPLRDWKDIDVAHLALLREPVDGLIVMFDRVTASDAVSIHSRRRATAPACRLRLALFHRDWRSGVLWNRLAGSGGAQCRLRGAHPRRREVGGPAGTPAGPIRIGRQHVQGAVSWSEDPTVRATAGHRGHRMIERAAANRSPTRCRRPAGPATGCNASTRR